MFCSIFVFRWSTVGFPLSPTNFSFLGLVMGLGLLTTSLVPSSLKTTLTIFSSSTFSSLSVCPFPLPKMEPKETLGLDLFRTFPSPPSSSSVEDKESLLLRRLIWRSSSLTFSLNFFSLSSAIFSALCFSLCSENIFIWSIMIPVLDLPLVVPGSSFSSVFAGTATLAALLNLARVVLELAACNFCSAVILTGSFLPPPAASKFALSFMTMPALKNMRAA
mmetsp:Transcript_8196/g.14893  ORF Transcript_8196/g.14893 Transcript_8196/m.14893 type:complete len:220 (+) Transcript_8196:2309-2968(+)